MHEFGWSLNPGDAAGWNRLAQGLTLGHLMECSGQGSGGNFGSARAWQQIPDLTHIGYPIAEVSESGEAVITKASGTGGRINFHTLRQQLLYEVHNPHAYFSPDVVLDMSTLALTDLGNVFGLVKFYQAASSSGIKPIIGCDVHISNVADRDHPFRLLLLCQSNVGYLRLCDLLTRAYRENQYRGRPELLALKHLHDMLEDQISKPQRWGSLRPVRTKSGSILWLCPTHAAIQEPPPQEI